MTKRKPYRFLICIILILNAISAFSQIEQLTTPIETFVSNHLQEKVFVHTDKENYVTGEILWFKLYATDALLNIPMKLSKIAYVEVLDLTHKSVLQAKIELKNSTGEGSFLIPYSLQSGNYIFRCYTGLMKNYSADFYFEKQLTIINPLKKPEWSEKKPPIFHVQFFPEGGNLVTGIESKIGFKVNDQYGNSFFAKGIVEDQERNKIVSFETKRFGLGQFIFKPIKDKIYQALIEIEGKTLIVELPKIFQQGTVMHVNESSEKKIVINVQTSQNIHSIDLLIHTRQVLKVALHQELLNGKIQFVVPDSLVGEGISQITIFDEQRHPLSERLYFKKPQNVLQINPSIDEKTYSKRQKVDLSINIADKNFPVASNLSLSVFLIDSLQHMPVSNILSYLWLESDLKGEIESPEFYFSDNPELSICTENLVLTHGWRRFQWEDILSKQNKNEPNLSELNGHIIWAIVTRKNDLRTAEGVTVYLSLPGEKPLFYQGISNKNGMVLFNIPPFFGSNQMILQTNGKADSIYRVDLMDPFTSVFSERQSHPFELNESLAKVLRIHSIQSQVGNVYYADQQQRFSFPETLDTVPFYGKATHRYFLDDYTRFITMEEVIREYVDGVRLRKSNNDFNLKLFNDNFQNYFETEPLILLDGVPIFNINQLIALDPLKIKRIELLNQQFYQNKIVLNGIFSCYTYQGDLAGFTLDRNALVIAYEGLQLKREFYQPVYKEGIIGSNRLPDFRNVLLWKPEFDSDILGKQKTSFYTSDVAGKYLIVIQGISKNGVAGYSTQLFEVK